MILKWQHYICWWKMGNNFKWLMRSFVFIVLLFLPGFRERIVDLWVSPKDRVACTSGKYCERSVLSRIFISFPNALFFLDTVSFVKNTLIPVVIQVCEWRTISAVASSLLYHSLHTFYWLFCHGYFSHASLSVTTSPPVIQIFSLRVIYTLGFVFFFIRS